VCPSKAERAARRRRASSWPAWALHTDDPIPTLQQWGLVALGLLILLVTAGVTRRLRGND
jgi:hypothetical protein